jgi:hypothetical protein
MPSASEEAAIRFLRGEENPFDAFVVPDKPAHEFSQCHVAEVHRDELERTCGAIAKYRDPDYATRRQLPETRVLIVRGVRGSGKTHLLHVLRQRDTETPECWVCPRHFDAGFPFAEYLLSELVRTILSAEEAEGGPRLRWCARALGRRLLFESVATLGPDHWPYWANPKVRVHPARSGGREAGSATRPAGFEALLNQLATGSESTPLADLCADHGLSPTAALALAMRHLDRTEIGTGAAVRMRREVLLAFCELAFRDRPDRLASLLEQDFAQPDAALPPARAETVTSLLQTLTEVLAAVRVPIVYAFDNMERLLAPRGPVDLPTAQSFFNGLAHLVDQTRGLLAILFVERGLWNQFGPAINTFADHRLRQGVRVRDYGCVWDLELKPPTPEQIEQVVRRRMRPLLARAPGGTPLPPCFPFAPEEVRQIATAGVDVLRTALLRLRDRYDEIVLPADQRLQVPAPEEPVAPGPAPAVSPSADTLGQGWEEAAAAGRRRLQMSRRTSLAQELHTGLGRWLELLADQLVDGWRLAGVRTAVAYGDHPTFGVVTVATWTNAQQCTFRVALAPVLGEGRAMPKDLAIKLSVLGQRPPIAEQLVVLWPVPQGPADVQQLPAATRQVWEQRASGPAVTLCALTLPDFAWLLGFPEWLAAHVAESRPEALQGFVMERTGYLLADLCPHESLEEPR